MESKIKLEYRDAVLELDEQQGAKILLLKFGNTVVIDGKRQGNFTGSGSYLMYPWVNRLQKFHKSQFKDGNGLPLHGLYCSTPRKIEIHEHADHVRAICKPIDHDKQFSEFTEEFILEERSLKIKFSAGKSQKPYCFGYHPYLQIGNTKLSQECVTFDHNFKQHLELQPSLLPVYPFKSKIAQITPGQKYDSLFQGGSHFTIKNKVTGKSVTISSKQLKYWQIYTPDDTRIAVEPMSFCGNIHRIHEQMGKTWEELPTEASILIRLQQ